MSGLVLVEQTEGSYDQREEGHHQEDSSQCSWVDEVQLRDGSWLGETAEKLRMRQTGRDQVGETVAVFEGELGLVVVGLSWIEECLATGCWRWISVYQILSL